MASTGEVWRLGRRPALDGLRGVAVLLVVATHIRVPGIAAAGSVGVTVFFVLSGFLITALLKQEHDKHGRVSLRGFYVRRARRLLPALAVCLATAAALDYAAHGRLVEIDLLLGGLTYTANWVMAGGAHADGSILGHMWSLAMEEQFYLLWPLALLAMRRLPRRWQLVTLGAAAAGSLVLRSSDWVHGSPAVYYGSLERVDALLMGCALALLLTSARRAVIVPAWVAAPAVATVAVATTVAPYGYVGYVLLPTIVGGASVVLVAVLVTHPVPAGPATLAWVGRRSYGLYLYHPLVVFAAHELVPGAGLFTVGAVVLPVSLALCAASWRWIEEPVLRGSVAKVLDPELQRVAGVGSDSVVDGVARLVAQPDRGRPAADVT